MGTGTNHSINELAAMYKEDVKYIPARPGEAWITLADISKTSDLLGWLPRCELESYVSSWLENNI